MSTNMKFFLTLTTAMALLCGCATQRFELRPTASKEDLWGNQTFWVSGIGQKAEIPAAKVCGSASKVASIEMSDSIETLALTFVTLGIYSPRRISVVCVK